MPLPVQRVVVLGAGTMGARLAAHCVNHGFDVTLLDRSAELAAAGVAMALQSRPAAFFLPSLAARIRVGSFADQLDAVGAADWVIEAIIEDLEAKHQLLGEVAPRLAAHAALTTNTSGLPIAEVGAILPAAAKRRWFGTHFFNPPRHMRLVEIIAAPETDPAAVAWVSDAIERRLGKGIVAARDTPNFIANRIGAFALLNTLRLMREFDLTVEQVDALTGPLAGWPKSATFRTLDLVGLDTLANVVRNSRQRLPDDERRELFQLPDFMEAMIQRGWLGDKSGQGFYKKTGDQIYAIDPKTLEYHPRAKAQYPEDLRGLLESNHAGGQFLTRVLGELAAYASDRIPEIADQPGEIDQAMRWGYNWQYGPFEVQKYIETGRAPRRQAGREAKRNPGCSLLDLGGGVGCIEFHSKMNAIGADIVEMVSETLADRASAFDAFVIGNGGENFSAGADLVYLLVSIQNEEWEEIGEAVRRFQAMTQAIKRSPRPVVAAPFNLALGGGCELALHAARVVAHSELYAGLVEAGVGLIPAGGGCAQMALRADPKTAFETIALAKVSGSAIEARQLHFLRGGDVMVANRDRLLQTAADQARQLVEDGYGPPAPAALTAPGPSAQSTLELGAFLMHEAGQITDHELAIARRLVKVLCGNGAPTGAQVPESHLLDLEWEAFLSLCGEAKTQQRISHMLKTGKALRN